ncbi:MAG: hypothetical protein NXI01_07905 [Gammaproteobacteria bacterium]|nr:hypothetical protein [Gammaproteobacteria bacterium]
MILPTILSTHTLQQLLPYREIDAHAIYRNRNSLGFGYHLFLSHPSHLKTVHTLISETHPPKSCHTALFLHRHSACEPSFQYYLFVSAPYLPQQRQGLKAYRQILGKALDTQNIPYQNVNATDFLIFLRTLISPNLHHTTWPGLIDTQQLPFQHLIPTPGTRIQITEQYLDILTTNHEGESEQVRLVSYHSEHPEDCRLLWAYSTHISERIAGDMLISLTVENNRPMASLACFTPSASNNEQHLETVCSDLGLHLQRPQEVLVSFFNSMPFGFTERSYRRYLKQI